MITSLRASTCDIREIYVVGHSTGHTLEAAKDIIAALFSFKGEPAFDPTPLYDEATLQAYLDPASRFHGCEVTSVPHARVRGSRGELTALYRKLDDSRQLALDEADLSKLSGLFGVAKDADCDLLVVDARPPITLTYEDSHCVLDLHHGLRCHLV